MSLKQTLSPFNRTIADISIVNLLTNEPMNTGLFINLKKASDLTKWSGSVSKSELTTALGAGDMVDKINIALNQSTAGGKSILPTSFFTAGMVFSAIEGSPTAEEKTNFRNWLELVVKQVVIDNAKQFCAIVFDDLTGVINDPDYIIELENMIRSYGSVAIIPSDTDDTITEAIINDTDNFFFYKTHEISTGVFEKGVDAAVLGRIVFQGVGEVDGVAKELSLITADKASVVTGDGGDLTVSEAQNWVDKGYNLYNQFASTYNETTGMVNPSGQDFTNIWVLLKVAVDISSDLNQLRHDSEKLTTSIEDQGTVRATIVSRMAKLKKNIIYDYKVTSNNLDYTLETNKGKFSYNVEVSLFQEGKWFAIDITGYQDLRLFTAEVA